MISFLFGLVFLGVYWFALRKPIKLDRSDWLLVLAGTVYLLYVHPSQWSEFGTVVRKTSALLLGCSAFLAARRAAPYFSLKIVCGAAITHLLVAIWQSVSPETHLAVFKSLMGEIRTSTDRGVGGANNEPSFLANIAILFPILAWMLSINVAPAVRRQALVICGVCSVGMLVLSQAGTGFFYGLMVLVAFGLSRGARSAAITVVLVTLTIVGVSNFASSLPESRATELMAAAAKDPKLIIEDPSASMRLVGHYLAGPSLLERPFGTGETTLDSTYFWFLWNRYNIESWYEIEVSRLSGQYYALGYGLTDVGANTLRMGSVFPLILLTWLSRYRGTKYSPTVIAYVSLGVLSSIPLVFPAYWLLLGVLRSERSRESNGLATTSNS